MKKLILSSAISALLATPTLVSAHGSCSADDLDHCVYWHDSAGVYAKDSSGQCVRTSSWKPGTQVEGCDAIKAKPAPKPMAMAPSDLDKDGVPDSKDQCPNTRAGVAVDRVGCPLDSDNDGVADYMDRCPGTTAGTKVNSQGCTLDSDGDGVADAMDSCPNTTAGAKVDAKGCEVPKFKAVSVNLDVQFGNNSDEVKSAYDTQMQAVSYVLKADKNSIVTINGHTDSLGSAAYNQALSQRRAEAVAKLLVTKYGVPANQVKAIGHGESQPVADNATAEGRAKNRRVSATVSGSVKQ